MIGRTLEPYLRRDAGFYPVVLLTGPRQSGKTTLVRATFPEHRYLSLEDGDLALVAREDPRGFLSRFPGPVVLDEVQRVPSLTSYLQSEVDRDPSPGRYVLTGSQNLLLMESVAQSLAGRCGVLHLLPFTRAELAGQSLAGEGGPSSVFGNTVPQGPPWDLVYSGFYPRIHDRAIPPEVWLADYVRTYVERDVRALVNVGDLLTFERFLRLCAGRVGQLLNYSALANDCGIAVDTARRWLSVLVTSFLAVLLPPFHRSFNKRVTKSPKLYFFDPGLASHLVGIRSASQLEVHPLRGALFENLVIAEVAKAYWHRRRTPPIFFWRDQTSHEVELLIEEGGKLYPVEIKSGATFASDMLTPLRWWSALVGADAGRATLVYAGDQVLQHTDIDIRPWWSV